MLLQVGNHIFNLDRFLHIYIARYRPDCYSVEGEFVNPAHPEGVDVETLAVFQTREEAERFLCQIVNAAMCKATVVRVPEQCGLVDYSEPT